MSKANVLYIHPPKLPGGSLRQWIDYYSFYALFPMGVIGLINLLRESGISVKGLNYAVEIDLNEAFNLEDWLGQQEEARVIMIDLHWYEHAFGAMEVAGICKKIFPEVPVVLGGFTASLFAKEIMENFPSVDFIVRGDAEQPLVQLVEQILNKKLKPSVLPNLSYRDLRGVVENPLTYIATPEDLDKLDFINIDFIENFPLYYCYQSAEFGILSSHWLCLGRGCMRDCSFCGGSRKAHEIIAGREKMILRSIKNVVEDIHRLHLMGIDQVSLSHDPAFLGKPYWSELFAEMGKKDLKIGVYNEFFQLPSEEFLKELAQWVVIPHSQAVFSPLSGDEGVRRFNGKLFTNSQFFQTLSILKDHSFPVTVYFSTNLPLEDNGTFETTLQMAKEIRDFYPAELLKMANICHTLDPCSPMSLTPDQYFIEAKMKSFMDYYNYCQIPPTATSDEGIDNLRGFRAVPSHSRSVGDMAARWQQFCGDQSQSPKRFEMVKGDGFLFHIPSIYSKRMEQREEWGYGEYFNPQAFRDDWEQFGVEGFFFYWTREKVDFSIESVINLCRAVADEKVFQPGYDLRVEEKIEPGITKFPTIVVKCSFQDPDRTTRGRINFYAMNNMDQRKIYVLGILVEAGGVKEREDEIISLLEDHVLSSFKFTGEEN